MNEVTDAGADGEEDDATDECKKHKRRHPHPSQP